MNRYRRCVAALPGLLATIAHNTLVLGLLGLALAMLSAPDALAQETSLLHQPYLGPVVQPATGNMTADAAGNSAAIAMVNNAQNVAPSYYPGGSDPTIGITSASWTYQPAPPLRTFSKNDIITIRVDDISRLLAQGNAQKRRTSQYKAILTDWLKLNKLSLGPAAQTDGDPSVAFQSNDTARNQATLESRESFTFNIAATIVDIRPNGNLVLEARKRVQANDNIWETALTGTCRAIDVGPDNVVLSKDVLDLEIIKDDQGQLRDGYRRGWFSRWFDRVQPF